VRYAHTVDSKRVSEAVKTPWKTSAVAATQKKRERAALRKPTAHEGTVDSDQARYGRRDGTIPTKDWNNRIKELRYLQDPLELATFVRKELDKGKDKEMLQLVRMASHSMQCIVSWNHIIDSLLSQSKVNEALKVYNEMKKRAQFPDSYTYTIVLRGLSANAHLPNVLSKALTVYHSLDAPNCRVQASIIHTNAALRVCARAMDLDALWGIAGKIPQSGPASANAITYITILNAIRQSLLVNGPRDESEEEAAARKDRAIVDARRMWIEIVRRWKDADLTIDEELVCAMGRLLLIGCRPRDWDDVLSLVEQTMDIPRLVPRLGTHERKIAGFPRLRAPNVPKNFKFDDDHLSPDGRPMRGDEFLPLEARRVGRAVISSLGYVEPGNNTLSMVQEACQKLVAPKAAQQYWDMLTDPTTYKVTPDMNNLHMRLRVLRQNRASTAAVELLENEIIAKGFVPRPGTFRLAMSTCVRDKNNHNSLRNAGKILQIMLKVLEDADIKAVGMYTDLASRFPLAKDSDYIDALTLLYPVVKNIRLQLGVGIESRFSNRGSPGTLTAPERRDAIAVLNQVHSVYDKLLFSRSTPEEKKAPFKAEKARLMSFIYRVGEGQRRSGRGSEAEDGPEEVDLHGYLQERPEG